MSDLSGIIKSIRNDMREDRGISGDGQRIEQLAWMLFLKIFDDKDKELELMDDHYKSPIPKDLKWRNWAADDEGMTGDELLNFVDQSLFPRLRSLNVRDKRAFMVREVFEGNNNYMKSGINIRKVLNRLNQIDFNKASERHLFGEIYETILQELQSAGDYGEFYTPRAITNFIVDIINPKLDERILDPACGTGGYLTSAIEHLKKQAKTIHQRQNIQKNVSGWEWKPLPYVLATTNLILHDVELPDITYRDALDKALSEYRAKDKVDVVIANPPFGGTVANNNESNFPLNFRTKESADLFLILIIHLLKDGGRAGIVLPDGSLSGEGVKQRIREKLLNDCNLHTIIRLPNSVFQPYAMVPTNLLFFEKGKQTKEIWYYEHVLPAGMKAYSKTKPIRTEYLKDIKKWWRQRKESEFCWKVSIEDLKERNFDLDIPNPNRKEPQVLSYKEVLAGYKKAQSDLTSALQSFAEELDSTRSSSDLENVKKHIDLVTNIDKGTSYLKSLLIGLAMQGKLTEQNLKDGSGKDLLAEIKKAKGVSVKLFPMIKSNEIPFEIPENWAWCRLGEIVTMIYGDSLTKAQCIPNGKYPVFGSNGIVGYYNKYLTEKKCIIVGRKGSAGALNICEVPSWTTDVAYYVEENQYLDFRFTYYLLKSLGLESLGKGIKPGVNRNEAYNKLVPLPPYPEQQRIVKKLEAFSKRCDAMEELIKANKAESEKLLQQVLTEALIKVPEITV